MVWTDKKVETLRRMLAEGASTKTIACAIGGISRNAVIGKMNRLGLGSDADAIRKKRIAGRRSVAVLHRVSAQKSVAKSRSVAAEAIHAVQRGQKKREWGKNNNPEASATSHLPPEDTVAHRPCSLMELTLSSCRWPFGNPRDKDFYFCGGAVVADGLPYCAVHARRAVVS